MTSWPIVFAVLVTTLSGSTWSCDVTNAEVLDDACTAPTLLSVTSVLQPSSAVGPGKCDLTFDKADFAQQPRVELSTAENDTLYTLVMVDPDASHFAAGQFYLHWMLDNVLGSDLAAGRLDRATAIAPYVKPSPPKASGLHRYMLSVYEQGARADAIEKPRRVLFELDAWLRNQSTPLCGPVAAVQFRAQF